MIINRLVIVLILISTSILQGQDFKFVPNKTKKFDIVNVGNEIDYKLKIANTSGDTLKMQWKTLIDLDTASWNYTLCDNYQCYNGGLLPKANFAVMSPLPSSKDTGYFLLTVTAKKVTSATNTIMVLVQNMKNTAHTDTVTFTFAAAKTAIENMTTGNIQLDVYPNPVTTSLTIHSLNLKSGTIEIMDILGNRITSITTQVSDFQDVPMNSLAKGMYILRYTNKDGDFAIRRFVKE